MKVVVTGGYGFIGSHFIRAFLASPAWRETFVVNLDLETYAANPANLWDVASDLRYTFARGDIADPEIVGAVLKDADFVVNFAAETHVDRSIHGAGAFVHTNVEGVRVLLDEVRRCATDPIFLQVSTDEIYGDVDWRLPPKETAPLQPSSPYSATKAAADLLVGAFQRTYGVRTLITRCSNNYGPYQFPEKLIPLAITNALEGIPIPVYGDGKQMRDWIHVEDHVSALLHLLRRKAGGTWNIGSGVQPYENVEVLKIILAQLGKDPAKALQTVKDRPGHDRCYALDTAKLRETGWTQSFHLRTGLEQTVDWYVKNTEWWRPLKERTADWYAQQYGN